MADFILGVAGHVDHGKTALTLALTGVDTDKLAEEKRRGLTIETGFAPFPLPDGGVAALVDVPGHEAFLRNMLSGAAGLDAAILTVAADDGVMPQTREHLDICTLLGVGLGLVVITKSDLADESRLAQVREEVALLTAGSFLEGAPVLPVSVRTSIGLEALRTAIAALATAPRSSRAEDMPFRLNIDRVFTREGFGTIITGTITSGAVSAGDELVLYPSGKPVRVRGLQSHGVEIARLSVGRRAALNLSGVDRDEVSRGDTIASSGSMDLTDFVEAELTLLPHAAPLKTGTRVRLYQGTRELLCRCTLRGRKVLLPGAYCAVRLRLEAPMAARQGDRFVVRTLSPAATVGGGIFQALTPAERQKETPDPLELLAQYHVRYPLRDGMNRGELLQKCGGKTALLEALAARGAIKLRGGVAALPGFRPKYTPELAKVRDQIEVYYRRAGLAPEENETVDASMGGEVMEKLVRDGILVPLGGRHRVHRVYYRREEEALRALAEREGVIALGQYRDMLGVSRKYALLLLEQFDRAGVTVKQGDCRVLAGH
ncbi:Selenocysteine-specific translation elongation factor [uncultured Eubacteriales bacterium]|uniref:Selenocysteine-specific elongation factor n=1 Tax=uncultured Eubacteriales bacterium TaxID=172733 RepID=A0A212KAZ5_9FIRM|nr:Selenocysteine-specific translation elongation factor [uncultured Eubacteriales bacterium]